MAGGHNFLAQLQQNPLVQQRQAQIDQAANQTAFNLLVNNPLTFLSRTPVVCQVGAGHQTVLDLNTGCAMNYNDELLLGNLVTAGGYPNRVLVPTLQSSTRASAGPNLVNRLAVAPRFGVAAGAQVWITDQQSGCTVIALEWGGGQFSMFHLLPYSDADWGRFARLTFSLSSTARAEMKNSNLRSEATQVATASAMGGAPPLRYIMIQSMHNTLAQRRMQTIGVQRNGGWEFYRQIQGGLVGNLRVESVDLAPWRQWSEYFYYDV
jgi:hypothetical protein